LYTIIIVALSLKVIVCLFVCLIVHTFIVIDIFFAVNDRHGYFVITALDSDNISILILSDLICRWNNVWKEASLGNSRAETLDATVIKVERLNVKVK